MSAVNDERVRHRTVYRCKGVNTLPMMVYSKAILESDYSVACMIALINILLSLGLFMLYRLAAARTGVRS